MNKQKLTVVIPMAGWGTRMRPHTYSKPKPLVSVAGRTTLEHLLDMFKTLPEPDNVEYVFIVSPHLGETQIPKFMEENYPQIKTSYIVQNEMKGQSHAIWLAREHLQDGPVMIVFSDSIIETDFSFLDKEQADAVAWVLPFPDPRRFGVAVVGEDGWVQRFIEKPSTMENNLVVIGCYYFKSGEKLIAAIEEQMARNLTLKGEFFLADTISVMIEQGAKVRTHTGDGWLDTGTIEATLETNHILLDQGKANKTTNESNNGVEIIAPSFIDPTAEISNSVIGPYASIGAGCRIIDSMITESIIEADCEILSAALSHSLIGRQATVLGRGHKHFIQLNVGDNSDVAFSEPDPK
jgi:glucose-1-phosphate thymidylyltransferase